MECSRQKHNRKRTMADDIKGALTFCEKKGLKPSLIQHFMLRLNFQLLAYNKAYGCTYQYLHNFSY